MTSNILATVDSRTQLAGQNRLELLLFQLASGQRFGINVFKVREVIRATHLSPVPKSEPVIMGIADVRGSTITVIDLSLAIGLGPFPESAMQDAFIIITEYNRNVQGFLVRSVDRIINISWKDVLPPPRGTGVANYLTAITRFENQLVEIIDVEQVFAAVVGVAEDVGTEIEHKAHDVVNKEHSLVMVADDSMVARNQIKHVLDQLGIRTVFAKDGAEALKILRDWASNDDRNLRELDMIISDIEMPNMDGYTLVTEIRRDERLRHLFVMLHTSLSGVFNKAMVAKVGADAFLAKFSSNELAQAVLDQVRAPRRHTEAS